MNAEVKPVGEKSLPIDRLRVQGAGPKRIRGRQVVDDSRPATIADLVEVLESHGYVVRAPLSRSEARRIAVQKGREPAT